MNEMIPEKSPFHEKSSFGLQIDVMPSSEQFTYFVFIMKNHDVNFYDKSILAL